MRQFTHRRDTFEGDSDVDSWSSSDEDDDQVILIRGRSEESAIQSGGESSNNNVSVGSQTNVSGSGLPPTFVEIGQSVESQPEPEDLEPPEPDFSEFMWMENEEEFDRQVLAELELCASLGQEYVIPGDIMMGEHGEQGYLVLDAAGLTLSTLQNIAATATPATTGTSTSGLTENLEAINLNPSMLASSSRLNPLAEEFIPQSFRNGNGSRRSSSSSSSSSDDSDSDVAHPKIITKRSPTRR